MGQSREQDRKSSFFRELTFDSCGQVGNKHINKKHRVVLGAIRKHRRRRPRLNRVVREGLLEEVIMN